MSEICPSLGIEMSIDVLPKLYRPHQDNSQMGYFPPHQYINMLFNINILLLCGQRKIVLADE